jgi:hypothetical protein
MKWLDRWRRWRDERKMREALAMMGGRAGDRRLLPIAGLEYVRDVDERVGRNWVTLQAEPSNHFDKNAIAIRTADDHHLGYVPRNMTADVRRLTVLPCEVEVRIYRHYDVRGVAFYTGEILI